MRMSCNGCRVLRKGCSEDCTIRPCLQWIKNPEAQGNATLFLAKFYGRAGLLNLIGAGPEHLRPAIFRSLLYESCGRIVNPIYGSVGLLWSGNWQMCQAAVEAVLKGAPVIQIPSETAASTPMPALKAFDIRHVPKDDGADRVASFDLHKVAKTTRNRFKRSGNRGSRAGSTAAIDVKPSVTAIEEVKQRGRAQSPESSASPPKPTTPEQESIFSMQTIDASTVTSKGHHIDNDGNVELELTLGHSPSPSPTDTTTATASSISPACSGCRRGPPTTGRCDTATEGSSTGKYQVDLGLHLRA